VVSRALVAAALLAGAGCGEEKPGVTIPCQTAADCPANLPMCAPDSKICVGCLDDFQTCGPLKTCDPTTHTCVPSPPDAACERNADCPRPGVDPPQFFTCEIDSGQCAACVTASDCPVGMCDPVTLTCVIPDLLPPPPDQTAPPDQAAPPDAPMEIVDGGQAG
jgi:hypothetical protein